VELSDLEDEFYKHLPDIKDGLFTRLLELGIEPYLVASSVIGVLAQRLVRRVCPDCAQTTAVSNDELKRLGLDGDALDTIETRRGAGCDSCRQTGYRGRRGIFELMVMGSTLRDLAFSGASTNEIAKAAINNGMYTLAMDGARKVLSGQTTAEEILRVATSAEFGS